MDNQICKIHNEPVLFFEQDALQNIELMCRVCVQQKLNDQNIYNINNEQKQALKQLELKYDQSINQLQDLDKKLEEYEQQIKQNLNKFKQQVQQNITYLIEQKSQIKSKSKGFTSLQLNQINEEENIINSQFTQIKQLLNNQLKVLEISNTLDQLNQLLNNLQIEFSNNEDEQVQNQKISVFNQEINYQLLQQSSYKQKEFCCAIAFNQDATIMIASCDKLIKVFQFEDDQLKQVDQLSKHLKTVSCLQFMKKSDNFISASYDQTIIIWKLNQNNQWQSNQVLRGHSQLINCVAINLNEDILISGGYDLTIKFWQKQKNIWSCYQSINCQCYIWSISLNGQEDKLIASLNNKQIYIIQLYNKEWIIKQKISFEQIGFRLSFIDQNQFVFQPFNRQYLFIFDYDTKDQCFKQEQKLQYANMANDSNCLFPIRYISSIGLIMVKNDHHVHLIKILQNGQFKVQQSINFGTYELFGAITNNGRYLATWDRQSKEIQIRKFDY